MVKKIIYGLLISSLTMGTFISTTNAEIKTYEGVGEYVMSDFETPDVAKQRAKVRAEKNAQEQAGVYVNSYTKVNDYKITEQETIAMTSGIMSITDINYDVTPSADGFIFRAKIKANIDTDEINKWLELNVSDRANLVARNEELQKAIAEQDDKIAELQKQLTERNNTTDIAKLKFEMLNVDNSFLSNQKIEIGNRFYFQGDYNSAIYNYTQAIELNSRNTIAYKNRGTSYANLGEYNRATGDFSRLIELEPDNVDAYIGRGASYIFLGNYQTAILDLSTAINFDPNNAMAYHNRGVCYQMINDMSRAYSDFARARRLGYRE